jgi:type II secretion system protein I
MASVPLPCSRGADRRTEGSSKGFTLIEVLVSLTVLAIGLIAAIKSTTHVQDALSRSRTQTLAARLGAAQLAHIKAQGPDNVASFQDRFEERPDMSWELTFENTPVENLKKLELIITSTDGREEIMTFEELVFVQEEP